MINILNILNILLIIMSIIILTRKNPMISLFNLIIFYILLGILLYKIKMNVLGLLYILIYVGAISVLFIFILSLINIKNQELYNNKKKNEDIYIILYTFVIILILIYNNWNINLNYWIIDINEIKINNIMELKIIGELLYVEYAIILLILGIIILLSIIAGILLIFR